MSVSGRSENSNSDASSTGEPNREPVTASKPGAEEEIAVSGFRVLERILLIVTAVMTVTAAGVEIWNVVEARSISLADILLMFLYTEVIAMIAVFYTGRGSPFIYPIFIAITALSRLIVLQGKDMDPQNILFEAAAIVLLAIAIVVLTRSQLGKRPV